MKKKYEALKLEKLTFDAKEVVETTIAEYQDNITFPVNPGSFSLLGLFWSIVGWIIGKIF